MNINFLSLGSGSSGNCYYLGTDTYGILIDAGIGIRTVKKVFKEYNIPFDSIHAIFITHDHADHIKAVGTLGEKYGIPVYATPKTHIGINKNYCMTEKLTSASIRHIEKEVPLTFKDFKITAFEVPHDGTDNVGYCIEINEMVFSFMTDLGHIPSNAIPYVQKTNHLIIEANYDSEMLDMGPYPRHLKKRIAGLNGHMCNRDTGDFLAEIYHQKLKNIWLCHLSKDNNHPELALKTVEFILRGKGIIVGKDVQLAALKRNTPSEYHEFE